MRSTVLVLSLLSPAVSTAGTGKADVCHGGRALSVSTSAVPAHLAHGDPLPSTLYADGDGDGYGTASTSVSACGPLIGYVADATDCDDALGSVHPGATDVPDDGIDQDCDGSDATSGGGGGGGADIVLELNQAGAALGPVDGAGDVNGDGFDDLVAAAYYYDGDKGIVAVWYGSGSGLTATPSWTYEPSVAAQISGAYPSGGVAGVGDVNGDGYDDICAAAGDWAGGQPGEGAWLVFYGSATGPSASPDWIVETNNSGSGGGSCVGAGDVDGDGYDDVVTMSSYYDSSAADDGRAWLYRGGSTGLSTTASWSVDGTAAGTIKFGGNGAGVGDANGDGYDDVVIASNWTSVVGCCSGKTWLYEGGPSGLSTTAAWTYSGTQDHESFGYTLAALGDVNDDGLGDLLVGVPDHDAIFGDAGGARVFAGDDTAGMTGPIWTIDGTASGEAVGWNVAGPGDQDGDGIDDVLVASTNTGIVWFYAGSAGGPSATPAATMTTPQPGSLWGYFMNGVGDLDGDGHQEFAIGAPLYDDGETDEGAIFVYFAAP